MVAVARIAWRVAQARAALRARAKLITFDSSRANSTGWIDELLAIERDALRLTALREGLRLAAPAFAWGPRDCGADGCDAFALFQGAVARAWRAGLVMGQFF